MIPVYEIWCNWILLLSPYQIDCLAFCSKCVDDNVAERTLSAMEF